MSKPYLTVLTAIALAGAVLAACVSTPPATPVSSLRGTAADAPDQAPAVRAELGKKPGAQKPIARTFEGQPPLIPHAMQNFDEVTLADNQCLECHGEDTYKRKNAPRLSESHYLDAAGRKSADMRRYQCTLCHAPQFDAPPIVDNAFIGLPPRK